MATKKPASVEPVEAEPTPVDRIGSIKFVDEHGRVMRLRPSFLNRTEFELWEDPQDKPAPVEE